MAAILPVMKWADTSVCNKATEFVGPSKRLIVGTIPCLTWVVGCFLIEGYAVGIRSRFYLEIVSTVLVACTLPTLWLVFLFDAMKPLYLRVFSPI